MRSFRWIALLALLLAAILPGAALAAEGDASIARQEQISEEYDGYIMCGCAAGGALYLCGNSHIFVYRPDDADVTAAEYQPPELSDDERWNLVRLFSDGEALYALASVTKIGADDGGEMNDLAQQFQDGKVSAADFLGEVDRKVRMRAMEGN